MMMDESLTNTSQIHENWLFVSLTIYTMLVAILTYMHEKMNYAMSAVINLIMRVLLCPTFLIYKRQNIHT